MADTNEMEVESTETVENKKPKKEKAKRVVTYFFI